MTPSAQSTSTRDRWLARLAWLVWAFNVLLWGAMMLLIFLPRPVHSPVSFVLQRLSNSTFILSAATVGACVAWRRSSNPIGWLLSVAALSWTGVVFLAEYGLYTLVENPGGAPQLTTVLISLFQAPTAIAITLVVLLFPTGHFLSPRWALVGWSSVIGEVVSRIGVVLTPGPMRFAMFSLDYNPNAVDNLPASLVHGAAGTGVYLASALLAAISLVVRFRRARALERQQLKWLAFGAMCCAVVVIPWPTTLAFRLAPESRVAQEVLPAAGIFGLALIPVAIGIALLRYRLYDIDIIINRTLVYGIVTVLLAGAFAALSVVAQHLTLAATGQESELSVVLAALAVTALFQPLRLRVQTLIDRRFYRSKYDASLTLERFASRVRDQVELDHLTNSLVAVVQETMQPQHASLWLRPRPEGEVQ